MERSRVPGPTSARAGRRPGAARRSQLDRLQLDLRDIVDAEAEARGVLDVAGLADEAVLVRIAVIAQMLAGAVEDRDGALRFTLGFDHVDEQAVDGDRVGPDHELAGIEAEARVFAER